MNTISDNQKSDARFSAIAKPQLIRDKFRMKLDSYFEVDASTKDDSTKPTKSSISM